MAAGRDLAVAELAGWLRDGPGRAEPVSAPLPVRWSTGESFGAPSDSSGGVGDVVFADRGVDKGLAGSDPEPDAVVRGWVAPGDEPRVDALFVLAGRALGINREDPDSAPLWLDLDQLVNLDAIGDPTPGPHGELQEVEIAMEDRTVLRAGWSLPFCDRVVETLERLAGRPASDPSRSGPDVRFEEVSDAGESQAAPSAAVAFSVGAPAEPTGEARSHDDAADGPGASERGPEPASDAVAEEPVDTDTDTDTDTAETDTSAADADARADDFFAVASLPTRTTPAPDGSTLPPGTLELEDVVYLGGYPGHGKRRKKCVATLGRAGLDLSGPADLHFRIAWDVVRTIEVQNADEARFRMNVKIHRNSSALVVECDQGVTILLEARDCPTLALRAAIGQLMADLPVVVV